jgi:hypothetical protein
LDPSCAFGDARSLNLRLARLGHVAILFTTDEKWSPFLRGSKGGMHEMDDFTALQNPCTVLSQIFFKSDAGLLSCPGSPRIAVDTDAIC